MPRNLYNFMEQIKISLIKTKQKPDQAEGKVFHNLSGRPSPMVPSGGNFLQWTIFILPTKFQEFLGFEQMALPLA
jgi:hypothetical protein